MNTKKKTLSVLTMAATALLFAACDKDEVGGPGDSHIFRRRYWRLLTLVIRVPKMYDGPFEATMLWRTFSSRLPGRNPGPTMRHGSKMQTDNGP